MIVAVSAENSDCNSTVSPYFGKSRWFVLFDTTDENREIVGNPYAESLGDAGIQSAQILVEKNVDALVCGWIGRNAFKVLSSAGIRMYGCEGKTVTEAIALFLDGELPRVGAPDDDPGGRVRRRRRRESR